MPVSTGVFGSLAGPESACGSSRRGVPRRAHRGGAPSLRRTSGSGTRTRAGQIAAGRTALVPFITAGYPDPDAFIDTLVSVAGAGDVVELGVPFSDPMADGMTIQRSSFKAIEDGVSLGWIFEQLDSLPEPLDTPLVMMSYLNPLLAFGFDKLARRALETGVCCFIVPDLPFEESDELRAALDEQGLGLIQLVTPATPPDGRHGGRHLVYRLHTGNLFRADHRSHPRPGPRADWAPALFPVPRRCRLGWLADRGLAHSPAAQAP